MKLDNIRVGQPLYYQGLAKCVFKGKTIIERVLTLVRFAGYDTNGSKVFKYPDGTYFIGNDADFYPITDL